MGVLGDELANALLTYGFWSFLIVVCEHSQRFLEAAVVTVVAVTVLLFVVVLPGWGGRRLIEQWAAGHEVDRAEALEGTYT